MKLHYKFILRIKDCKQEFKKGFGPGVLLTQEVSFTVKDLEEAMSPKFAMALISQGNAIMHEHIEVVYEPVEETTDEK